MDMVRFAVHLDQFGIKIFADFFENSSHRHVVVFLENPFPVFCHKDQMHMEIEDTMST